MIYIWFFLACISLTNILVNEYVFGWWRNWIDKTFPYNEALNTLVNCTTCTGFWVGFFGVCFFGGHLFMPSLISDMIVGGLLNSFLCKIVFGKLFTF